MLGLVQMVTVAVDARYPNGQTAALRRFMVVSRGSLQSISRSVDGVSRSLLEHMMAGTHRTGRLIQLELSGLGYEQSPEVTGEAPNPSCAATRP